MYHFKGSADNGGGYACVEAGGIWVIAVPSAQYCYDPKTALKNKNWFLKNSYEPKEFFKKTTAQKRIPK